MDGREQDCASLKYMSFRSLLSSLADCKIHSVVTRVEKLRELATKDSNKTLS